MLVRRRTFAIVLLGCLLAACSAEPVSEATTLASPPGTGSPSTDAGPASAAPSASAEAPGASAEAPSPAASLVITIKEAPPKPGKPTFKLLGETQNPTGTVTQDYEITWTAPTGVASTFLVYGLTKCLRYAKKYDQKPCVVRGMPVPVDSLVLLGQAPGDARSLTVSWDQAGEGPAPYAAILIRATNPFGNSIFTIVHSENVCYQCVY